MSHIVTTALLVWETHMRWLSLLLVLSTICVRTITVNAATETDKAFVNLFFVTQAARFVTCQMTMEINQHGDTSTPFSQCYQNAVTGFDRQKQTLMATFDGKPNALALLERYRTAWFNAMQAIEPHENETTSAYEIRQRNLRNAVAGLRDLIASELVKDM